MAPTKQSRRFLLNSSEESVEEIFKKMVADPEILYVFQTKKDLYFEIVKDKTAVGGVRKASSYLPHFEPIRYFPFEQEEKVAEHGNPLAPITKKPPPLNLKKIQPKEVFDHAVYYGEAPDLGEVYIPSNTKVEIDAAYSQGIRLHNKKNYDLTLRPWQAAVINHLESGEMDHSRQVLWVFDKDGNTGKSELVNYLVLKKGFQKFKGSAAGKMAHRIRGESKGFVIDITRGDEKNYAKLFPFIEEIKDGEVHSHKYAGREVYLSSRILVVFCNFIPNLKGLSMDRWVFFHTKLGLVNIKCAPSRDTYVNTIAMQMSCTAPSVFGKQADEDIPDEELIKQYLQSSPGGLEILFRNKVAFPEVKQCHHKALKTIITLGEDEKLRSYVKQFNLLAGSILQHNPDFIRAIRQPFFQQGELSDSSDDDLFKSETDEEELDRQGRGRFLPGTPKKLRRIDNGERPSSSQYVDQTEKNDDTPSDDAPSDDAPSDDAPSDDAPSDDAPSDDADAKHTE